MEAFLNLNKSYTGLKLLYGSRCPPLSTLKGWVQKVQSGGQITNPGRPRLLTDAAEARVLEFVAQARKDGAVIDRETLALLGKEV